LLALTLAVAAAAVFGEYPTDLSAPTALVMAMSAVTCAGAAILALGFPRGRTERPSLPIAARAGLVLGVVNALVFVVLVVSNVSWNQDSTIPAAARWIPIVLGFVASVLGAVGLATARGDGRTLRASLAALLLGAVPALTSFWLGAAYCSVFTDRATACTPR
jgi:hypothetical protein